MSQEIELFTQLKGLRREPKTHSKFSRLQRSYSCFPFWGSAQSAETGVIVTSQWATWQGSPSFSAPLMLSACFQHAVVNNHQVDYNLVRLMRVMHKNSKWSCDFNFIIRKRMTKIWKLLLTSVFTGPDSHVCKSCNFRALLPRVLWRLTALCSFSVVAKQLWLLRKIHRHLFNPSLADEQLGSF